MISSNLSCPVEKGKGNSRNLDMYLYQHSKANKTEPISRVNALLILSPLLLSEQITIFKNHSFSRVELKLGKSV